jgi:hypothetical protein
MIKLQFNENFSNSLTQQIFAFLDKEGGYTDYNQKIEDVAETFGLSEKEAESFVWDWSTGLYNNDIDEDDIDEDYLAETQAYNLDNSESRRKEIADRFGRTFTPDDHILVCKDGKKLNIQVGKKYKCTACNGQRVEIVSIDDIYTDDRGDTASITAYYRGKLIMIGSTQLYESIRQKRSVKESYRNNWEEIGTETLYINDDRLRLPRYEKRIDKIVIHVVPEDDNDELVWTVYYTPEIGMAGFKFVESGFFTSGEAMDYVDNEFIPKLSIDEEYMIEKISDKDYSQSKKGIAYKVFQFKDGKLYPPMVANAGNKDTPVGVWLDAEPGEFVEIDGLQRVVQRGVKGDKLRQRVANLDNLSPEDRKAEIKKIKSSTLAYRPGWHLGDEPRAAQFDREASWEILDELPEGAKVSGNVTNEDTLAKKGTPGNIGKYFLIKSTGKYAHIFGGNGQVFFPYNFVWAECEYIMDIDYQDEAMSYGYRKGKKFQHSLAGLPRVPEGGSYKYRTNPRPDTVPWVITGAIKVTKLLDDFDVQRILGNNAPERQGGDKTLAELGLKQI